MAEIISIGAGAVALSGQSIFINKVEVPAQRVAVSGGAVAIDVGFSFELELPVPELSSQAAFGRLLETEIILPVVEVAMTAVPGNVIQGAIEFPLLELQASVERDEIVLPLIIVEGEIARGDVITGRVTLPLPIFAASVISDRVYSGSIILPLPVSEAEVISGAAINASITLPQLRVVGDASTGSVASVVLTLPLIEMDGLAYGEYNSAFDLILPAIQMQGAVGFAYSSHVAYNLNVMNAALSEYDNYGFNSFARFNGACLAANENGIYLLSGEDDAGQSIDSEVQFGDLDFGTSLYKRVVSAYIGYQTTGDMVLTVNTDTDQFKYMLPSLGKGAFHTNKMNLAKGIRSRYWRFGISNVNGADFKLDTIEAVPVILTRRIG